MQSVAITVVMLSVVIAVERMQTVTTEYSQLASPLKCCQLLPLLKGCTVQSVTISVVVLSVATFVERMYS